MLLRLVPDHKLVVFFFLVLGDLMINFHINSLLCNTALGCTLKINLERKKKESFISVMTQTEFTFHCVDVVFAS